ncbi:MAG: serine/threonine protein kinase [Myxococcales bacterium]|nr:serine/threonine protein kinase [Myxococcales bacterium]
MTTDDEKPPGRRSEPISLSGRTVAGRYRVVGVVGQGGIGKVYEAEQIGLDRTVAVKVIRPERRDDQITIRRFLREARAAGRISSPHVVTLFDCGTDDDNGELYIAMELLSGQSLSRRLADGEVMELGEVLRTAAMIARGLRAAHEAGVLHRDLKPANVFLCDDGNVKVLDFGIAKLLDESAEETLTQVNRILGTPVYMSPEAATRQPLGPTTDLYALGLLIYEMVVGAPPFKTGDAWKTLEAHVKTEPPRLSAAAPWRPIPRGLDELVARLLEKKPQDRPRDAGEVAGKLDRMAMELALAESRPDDLTEVEVHLPPARPAPRPERPAPPIEAEPPEMPEMPSDDVAADDGLEATTVWQGNETGPHPARPPEEVVGRPFPKEELEAYRRAKELETRPARPSLAGLTQRQLAVAAVVLGGITFVTMLLLRLLL